MKNSNAKVLFIANGLSKDLRKIERQLLESGLSNYHFYKTIMPEDAINIAKEQVNDYTHIVAVGGDGTLHEVINGIMSGKPKGERPVISLIPAGTANDFAKSLPFPSHIKEFIEALQKGEVASTDLCKIRYTLSNGETGVRYFINIADAGIGAAVVHEVNNQSQKWGANVAFFRAIIKAFRKYENVPIHCVADTWEWKGPVKMFVMANGRCFGSGLMIAPHARLNDGKIAITIGGNISTYDYIKNLPTLKRGGYIDHPELYYKEATDLKITSLGKCPIEADGEFIGYTPAEISIKPNLIQFLIYKKALS